MMDSPTVVRFGLALAIAALTPPALADADLRSYHVGNSLTEDAVPGAFPAFAGQRAETHEAGWHIDRNRGLPFIASHPTSANGYQSPHGGWATALSGEAWDVVTLQLYPSDGSNLASDVSAVVQLIDRARENVSNVDTRFLIYAPWSARDGDYTATWDAEIPGLSDTTGTQRKRAYNEEVFARVVEARPDARVELLMTGELFNLIDQAIKEAVAGGGDWLGFADVDELYRDTVHLDYETGRWLASLAMWSAVTGQSPAGLTRPDGRFESNGGSALDANAALRDGLSSFVADSMGRIHQVTPEPTALGLLAPAALSLLTMRVGR